MYVRHFFKMIFWLIIMAGIGIGGLVLANYYAKGSVSVSAQNPGVATGK